MIISGIVADKNQYIPRYKGTICSYFNGVYQMSVKMYAFADETIKITIHFKNKLLLTENKCIIYLY